MLDITTSAYIIAAVSVVLIGISKAGFGGGVGIIATPLMALALPVTRSVGILLPLLLACDIFALFYYRRSFNKRSVLLLVPGTILGVIVGARFLGRLDDVWLKFGMGVLAVSFVMFEVVRAKVFKSIERFHPGPITGTTCGALAGFSSTLAHAAGPFAAIYLLPQHFDRKTFVGTNTVFFAFLNGIKMPFYIYLGILEPKASAALLPFVPVGVALGIWANRSIDEKLFKRIIYVLLFLMGVQLIIGRNLFSLVFGG